jgi:hypothetical protein
MDIQVYLRVCGHAGEMELKMCGHTGVWESGYMNMEECLTGYGRAGISDDIMDMQE